MFLITRLNYFLLALCVKLGIAGISPFSAVKHYDATFISSGLLFGEVVLTALHLFRKFLNVSDNLQENNGAIF